MRQVTRWSLAVMVVAHASATLAQSTSGFSKGPATRSYSANGGVPLMKSFYFRYTSSDHHIRAIQAMPDSPALGEISVNYQDKNTDDEYFFNVQHQPYFGTIFARSYGRDVCVGSCTREISAPANRLDHVFVIRGFYLYFHGTDHHLDQISVKERDGQVTVAYNDKNDDDTFLWDLDYAYVPRAAFSTISTRAGSAQGATRASIEAGTALIRGFDLNFASGDHHIKEVGIWMAGDGNLDVYYGDKNGDDSFNWTVEYAVLRPPRIGVIDRTIIHPPTTIISPAP